MSFFYQATCSSLESKVSPSCIALIDVAVNLGRLSPVLLVDSCDAIRLTIPPSATSFARQRFIRGPTSHRTL